MAMSNGSLQAPGSSFRGLSPSWAPCGHPPPRPPLRLASPPTRCWSSQLTSAARSQRRSITRAPARCSPRIPPLSTWSCCRRSSATTPCCKSSGGCPGGGAGWGAARSSCEMAGPFAPGPSSRALAPSKHQLKQPTVGLPQAKDPAVISRLHFMVSGAAPSGRKRGVLERLKPGIPNVGPRGSMAPISTFPAAR